MYIDPAKPLEEQFPKHSQYGSHKDWPKWLSGEWDDKRKRRHLLWCHMQASRWLDNPDGTVTLISTHGRKMTLNNGWMARELMASNLVFQKQNTKKFHELLGDRPGIIIDVGANLGSMSLEYASWGRHVEAFECGAYPYSLLTRNIADNNLHNQITSWNLALGLSNCRLRFKDQQGESLGQGKVIAKGGVEVECRSLDSFAFNNVAGIKIDVEGFDWAVIKGGLDTIKRNRPVVQFEACNAALKKWYWHASDLVRLFDNIGYRVILIDGTEASGFGPTRDYWCIPS